MSTKRVFLIKGRESDQKRPERIRLIPTTHAFTLALPFAAQAKMAVSPIAKAPRVAMASVHDSVERVTDEDEFWLIDTSGAIRFYIGPCPMPIVERDLGTVAERVEDGIGLRKLYAQSLTKVDGSMVTFGLQYE